MLEAAQQQMYRGTVGPLSLFHALSSLTTPEQRACARSDATTVGAVRTVRLNNSFCLCTSCRHCSLLLHAFAALSYPSGNVLTIYSVLPCLQRLSRAQQAKVQRHADVVESIRLRMMEQVAESRLKSPSIRVPGWTQAVVQTVKGVTIVACSQKDLSIYAAALQGPMSVGLYIDATSNIVSGRAWLRWVAMDRTSCRMWMVCMDNSGSIFCCPALEILTA